MALIDVVQAGLFSLGVLAVALAGGCIFSMLTVQKEEVDCIVEKRVEYGVFGGACIIFASLIGYALS
ncbi:MULTISPECIES: hypothetical protein [Photobacterium]|uniref:Membrane protein n=1 Tax=Photobacterium halotolerans TaxID=265726 RepID=A0A0F5VHK7_9GAMM|nr:MULTISPECIES: hypothetical protein [Photobacterium]KKD00985.1 membrane protein [Photobacterium halotolerans]UIP28977.1 hypothetical protein LN341_05740 [Photobacterium sp. TLY01]